MKKILFTLTLPLLFVVLSCRKEVQHESMPGQQLFNLDWSFLNDSLQATDSAGILANAVSEDNWRKVDLPHDWSILDLPGEPSDSQVGPFSKKSPGGPSTGHVMGGTAWYKKVFRTGKEWNDKLITILFDGVYQRSEVWLNGHYLGFHPYGYTPFSYDLTPYLKAKGENILLVRVQNPGKNSRWYSGSGIYRNVSLRVTGLLHFTENSLFITTPSVSSEKASVHLNAEVSNTSDEKQDLLCRIHLLDSSGRMIAVDSSLLQVGEEGVVSIEKDFNLLQPGLWSPDSPVLYSALLELESKGIIMDRISSTFGIRSIVFSASKGFLLNGEPVEMKGGCLHHDNGLLGAAAFPRAEERRVAVMKTNGYNAIRTSHNPPSAAFLDACDRLGMLVIDEAFDHWEKGKNPEDNHLFFRDWWKRDVQSMVLRDRNHPSVIIWSIGNEIQERADTSGVRIAGQLKAAIRECDTTRPITAAICDFWDNKGMTWSDTPPAFSSLDIGGYNYQWKQYEPDHKKFPERIIMGTESFPFEIYESWEQVKKHPYVIGDFIWTGVDYLGEAGIGHAHYDTLRSFHMPWTWYNAWCGDIDILGNKKPQSYYHDVVWDRSDLEMLVHEPIPGGKKEYVSGWGWPLEYPYWSFAGAEGQPVSVRVFTTGDQVRLFLNGSPVGEKPVSEASRRIAVFELPYAPGELKAVAYRKGKELAAKVFRTPGEPAALGLIAEQSHVPADRNELIYFRVQVVDKDGNLVPAAKIPLSITLEGPAELQAAGNASPDGMSSFTSPEFMSWQGRGLVILRPKLSPGLVSLRISSPGLKEAIAQVEVVKK
ncbi:MAG: glycoside hydrolase family 2 TIM barrel-domain containing protein [Bacteroidales bacterium]